jgi:hypothetical protein
MVGTGMLTIPWAYSNSGFVLGLCTIISFKILLYIVVTLLSFLLSYYTCYLVLITAGKDVDFTETMQK